MKARKIITVSFIALSTKKAKRSLSIYRRGSARALKKERGGNRTADHPLSNNDEPS